MRVCFVSPTWWDGGSERSMIDLIDALTARGVECRVVIPGRDYVAQALEARRITYAVYSFRPWTRRFPLPLWDRLLKKPLVHSLRGARLARMIRSWKCDVVVTNTLTCCEGALGARLLGIPHVTHVREFGDLDHGLHFEFGPRLSMRILSALSKLVVFNSKAVAGHYERQVPPDRARVVYNAVPVPPMPATEQGKQARRGAAAPFLCVLVGTVAESKGHEEALRAVHDVIRRGLPVRLTIVGSGSAPYVEYLRRLIDSLGLAPHVDMVGYACDPYPFFRRADVALMCSRMEAFGRVVLEAMKMGTPVIGARSGGTPEAIRDGFNGLLYTPGDWKGLADKIQVLCEDRQAARRLGQQAREWATRTFTLERYGDEMLAVLGEATGLPDLSRRPR